MRVFIGLGSNLGKPCEQIEMAVEDIQSILNADLIAYSALYKSSPIGPQDQPDYINAVVELNLKFEPHLLLNRLQSIEQQYGRIHKRYWGERTLDLDLLLYGKLILNDGYLTIPHPEIAIRPFVIYPLADLNPQLEIPGVGNVEKLIKQCPYNLQQMKNIYLHSR